MEEMLKRAKQLLDNLATQEAAVLTYRASNIHLVVHSSTSYLSESSTRSRTGGHFFMTANYPILEENGAVLTTALIIKVVMSSLAEAEIGVLYINAR